jgi:hypothetical protein
MTVTINPATGVLTRTGAGTPGCAAGAVVGRFAANPASIDTVGEPLPLAPAPVVCATTASLTGQYAPIYSVMTSGTPRIIGFARVGLTRAAICPAPGAPFAATITRGVSLVAAANATAAVPGALPLPVTAMPSDVQELLDKNLVAPGRVNYAPILVAVIAR